MHRHMALSGQSWPNPQFRAHICHGLKLENHLNDVYDGHVLYNAALVPFFTTIFWDSSVRQFGLQALRIPHLIKSTRQMDRPLPQAQICQNQYVDPAMRVAFQQDVNLLQVRREAWAKLRPWYQHQIVEWEGSIYGCVSFIQDLANLKKYYQRRDEAGVQEIVQQNVTRLDSPWLNTDPILFYTSAVYYLFFAALPVRRAPETTSRPMFVQRTEWGISRAVRDAPDDIRAPYVPQQPFQNPYTPDGGFGMKTTTTTLLPRHAEPCLIQSRTAFLQLLGNMYTLQERRYAATWPLALSQLFWAQHALLMQDATRMVSRADEARWLPSLSFELPDWPLGARGLPVGPGGGGLGSGPGGGPRDGGNGGQGRGVGRGREQNRGGRGWGRGGGCRERGGRDQGTRGGRGRSRGRGGSDGGLDGGGGGGGGRGEGRGHIWQGGPSNTAQTVLPSSTGSGRSTSGGDMVDQIRSQPWQGGGGSWRGGKRGFRAAKATIATSRKTSSKAEAMYGLPLPFLSIAEVGDHKREDDLWVLGNNDTLGYDVYDATGESGHPNFYLPWRDLRG